MQANPASKQAAIDWVGGLPAKGGTDILLSIKAAAGILNNPDFAADSISLSHLSLPSLF
jgi:hypothetical protein